MKNNRTRHIATCGSDEKKYRCGCGKGYKRSDHLKGHLKTCNGQPSAPEHIPKEPTLYTAPSLGKDSKSQCASEQEEENDDDNIIHISDSEIEEDEEGMWTCRYCDVTIHENEKLQHCTSIEHKERALIPDKEKDTYLIGNCFDRKMVTYRILNKDRTNLDMKGFLNEKKKTVTRLINEFTKEHITSNAQLEVTTKYTKIDAEGEVTVGTVR